MKNNTTSRIVSSLNEGINTSVAPVIEHERTVGSDAPVQVHQCDDCACFYTVSEKMDESVCPKCGGVGEPYANLSPIKEGMENDEDDPTNENDEDEIRSEAEVVVSEALRALERSDFKKFNESYRPRTRMTTKGELEVIMESTNGKAITVARKMTSRQKAAYQLSEKFSIKSANSSAKNAKNESIKLRRQELVMRNESRAVKVQAGRILERMGVRYNHQKFNEQMSKFISNRPYNKMLESINNDDEIGKSELDKMTPDEIGDSVNTVIADTGLNVVNNTVDIDGETATVTVRVEDSPELEVHADEVGDVLSDVFDAPVEVVGPTTTDGDSTLADLAIVINPDDSINEEDGDGRNPLDTNPDDLLTEDDGCPMSSEKKRMMSSEKGRMMSSEKNESMRRRKRSKVNEKFTTAIGDSPLFALKATDCAVGDPCFLANDDSLVSGNEDGAENLARVFVSQEAAANFVKSAGLEGKFEPVSISVITNECDGTDNDYVDPNKINEGEEPFETKDGSYFEKDGYYYFKDHDGKVTEVDKAEFDEARAGTYDVDNIKESMRRRRNSRRK